MNRVAHSNPIADPISTPNGKSMARAMKTKTTYQVVLTI